MSRTAEYRRHRWQASVSCAHDDLCVVQSDHVRPYACLLSMFNVCSVMLGMCSVMLGMSYTSTNSVWESITLCLTTTPTVLPRSSYAQYKQPFLNSQQDSTAHSSQLSSERQCISCQAVHQHSRGDLAGTRLVIQQTDCPPLDHATLYVIH